MMPAATMKEHTAWTVNNPGISNIPLVRHGKERLLGKKTDLLTIDK
jgi:hypothetical protein